jgi:hypothetical protein
MRRGEPFTGSVFDRAVYLIETALFTICGLLLLAFIFGQIHRGDVLYPFVSALIVSTALWSIHRWSFNKLAGRGEGNSLRP